MAQRASAGPIIANPDPDREPKQEVPQLQVESLEHLGSMLELDPSTLDPNFKYRWVNTAPLKLARARAKGYRTVDAEAETIKNAVGDSPEAEGGVYRVGDVVLMKTPLATHKARRKEIRRKTEARLKGPEKKFRREAQQHSENYGEPIEVVSGEAGEPNR